MVSAEFLITSLLVVLVPGTGVIYTLSNALFEGARASVAAALGCTLGIVPHIIVALLGLSAILQVNDVLFNVVRTVGVCYLFYLGWLIGTDGSSFRFTNSKRKRKSWDTVLEGILINILNPKLSLFFLVFLPQFLSPQASSPLFDMGLLGGIFMLMTFGVFVLYGLFATTLRSHLFESAAALTWTRRAFAFCFFIFGAKLALT